MSIATITRTGTTVRVTDGDLVRKARKAAERHRDDCRSSVDADGTTTYWTGARSVPATCTWDLVAHPDGGWFVRSVLRVHLPLIDVSPRCYCDEPDVYDGYAQCEVYGH